MSTTTIEVTDQDIEEAHGMFREYAMLSAEKLMLGTLAEIFLAHGERLGSEVYAENKERLREVCGVLGIEDEKYDKVWDKFMWAFANIFNEIEHFGKEMCGVEPETLIQLTLNMINILARGLEEHVEPCINEMLEEDE